MCELSSGLHACTGAPGDAWRLDCTTLMRRLWRPGLLLSRQGHMAMQSMPCLLKVGQERSAVQMRNQEGLKLAWWEDLAHRSLGVGVVDVSDWKEKLQEGSGGTSWGLAGQGNQSEVWVEHWKRKKKLHTTPGMKSRCLKAVVPLLPDCHLMKPTNRSVLSLTMLVLTLPKTSILLLWAGSASIPGGLPMANQNTSALFLICVGIRVVPGHEISAFSICSFKNQHKNCRKTLLKLQIQVLQSLRLFA